MPSKGNPASDVVAEWERRTSELLRAQQEAYLAAVKAWREGLPKDSPPPWPQATGASLQPTPTAGEIAEASYAFAAKLLADQSRFMAELSKAMGGVEPPRDGSNS